MRRGWILSACLAALFALTACDLAEEDLYALHISSPADDQTFLKQEDTDLYAAGMQIAVQVETAERRVPVELLRLVGGTPEVIARAITADGVARIPSVTLFPGANRLQARDTRSGRTSLPITVYFEEPCGQLSFLSPEPASSPRLLLGPKASGSCGQDYTIPLLASTGLRDGTRVSVLINKRRVASGVTRGGTLSIPEVPIEPGSDLQLSLLVEDENCAEVPFPTPILLDCNGPHCKISSLRNEDKLNSLDDLDPNIPGLNLDITVDTDLEGAGQIIELAIDGDLENAYRERAVTQSGNTRAIFRNVSLPEGSLRLGAVCTDAAGVSARNQVSLHVDTSGCNVSLVSPAQGSMFVSDEAGASYPVNVVAAFGSDCAKARFAESAAQDCVEALENASYQEITLGQTSMTQEVILSQPGERFLCVGTLDAQGNPSIAQVPIRFDNQAPSLHFETPAGALRINRAGLAGALVDLDPSTRACESQVSVRCSNEGHPVLLVRVPDEVTLAEGVCTAGQVVFASVPFPSQNDGSSYEVVARTRSPSGLWGRSQALEVHADCDPPALAFADYRCGVTALAPEDDEDLGSPGIQRTLRVLNSPNAKAQVELTVRHQDGNMESATSNLHDGPYTLFPAVNFAEGVLELSACATDAAGNTGCTGSCELLVGDVPKLQFLEPASDGLLYALDLTAEGVVYREGIPPSVDCDAAPGLQIPVRAQVGNASPGTTARVELYAANRTQLFERFTTEVNAANEVVACLQSVDGYGLVLRIEVDAAQAGLYGAAERTIHAHSTAPTEVLLSTAEPGGCREPDAVRFLAPDSDEGPSELAFELRCAATAIETEAAWALSQAMPLAPQIEALSATPGTATPMRFRLPPTLPDTTRHCSVRGYDHAGAYTPLGASHAFSYTAPSPQIVTYSEPEAAPSSAPSYEVTALGDVNGDGFDDVLISGGDTRALGTAALFLGSATGLSATPDVRFVSRDAYGFGQRAVALGNFDNDAQGLMDFAIASPLSGRVFVVFGRAQFPVAEIPLDAGGCSADLCIATQASTELGKSLTSARFDLDDIPDLVASEQRGALVLLGSALHQPLARLGASGTGKCLDASVPPADDACGNGASTPASGFRLQAGFAVDEVVSSARGTLFLAHNGSETSARLWGAPRKSYPQAAALISLKPTHLTLVHQASTARPGARLLSVGDVNGDGFSDLAWTRPLAQTITLLSGAMGLGVSPMLELTNNLPDAAGGFGHKLGLGQHPELGLLADLDENSRADLLVSALKYDVHGGSVELFHDLSPFSGSFLRTNRSFLLDSTSLPAVPNPPERYRREGQWLGDVDGDGHLDFAILEPDFEAGFGRLLVLGVCGI